MKWKGSIDDKVKQKPKYPQPQNINLDELNLNEIQAEHLKLKIHARQKYEATCGRNSKKSDGQIAQYDKHRKSAPYKKLPK